MFALFINPFYAFMINNTKPIGILPAVIWDLEWMCAHRTSTKRAGSRQGDLTLFMARTSTSRSDDLPRSSRWKRNQYLPVNFQGEKQTTELSIPGRREYQNATRHLPLALEPGLSSKLGNLHNLCDVHKLT